MKPSHIAVGVLMLALGLPAAAQRGGFGRGRRAPAPTPTEAATAAATTALVDNLYRTARTAINQVPSLAAPILLTNLAEDELRTQPTQALADYQSAFNLALALPAASAGGDGAGDDRGQIKAETEQRAVAALARAGQAAAALDLARRADVAKAPLYDVLLQTLRAPAASTRGGRGRSRFGGRLGGRFGLGARAGAGNDTPDTAPPTAATFTDQVFSLVAECRASDGTYPYSGVAAALRRPALDAISRTMLLEDAYLAAGNETAAGQISAALPLLQVGQRAVPGLNPQLETVLITLWGRLQGAAGGSGNARTANRVLGLLRRLDPARAASLAQEQSPGSVAGAGNGGGNAGAGGGTAGGRSGGLTGRGSSGRSAGRGVAGAGGNGRGGSRAGGNATLFFSFSTTVAVPATDQPGETVGASEFRSLVTQAEGEWRTQPNQALSAANRAAGMLDAGLWASELAAAGRLATVYAELGATADAGRLVSQCLTEADRQGRAFDTSFHDANAGGQAQLALDGGAAEAAILATYSLAARIDLETTAERAEESSMVLLKPLILSRVALVAQAGERGRFGFGRGFRGGRFGGGA